MHTHTVYSRLDQDTTLRKIPRRVWKERGKLPERQMAAFGLEKSHHSFLILTVNWFGDYWHEKKKFPENFFKSANTSTSFISFLRFLESLWRALPLDPLANKNAFAHSLATPFKNKYAAHDPAVTALGIYPSDPLIVPRGPQTRMLSTDSCRTVPTVEITSRSNRMEIDKLW